MDDCPEGRTKGCFADVLALADDTEREHALNTIGRPEELATAAITESLDVWSETQLQLAAALEDANLDDAPELIDAWATSIASNEDLASTVYRVALHADLAGQLFVRTIEVPELRSTVALDDRPVPPFLRLTFEEALDFFLERKIITPEQFQALSDEQRTRAFTATRLASDALRARAYELLQQALANGSTLRDFVRALNADEASLGVTPSDSHYLETIYRTNLSSAYNAGRYRQITSDVVRSARPYVQFRATRDNRTTTVCNALHGKVFRQDDPAWQRFAPPLHFQCRSVIVAVREATEVTDASTITAQPQRGFGGPTQ